MAGQARAYSGFCSMKQLGIFLLALYGMLVHRRVTPALSLAACNHYLGGGRHYESKVSCPGTQHNV